MFNFNINHDHIIHLFTIIAFIVKRTYINKDVQFRKFTTECNIGTIIIIIHQ